MKTLLTIIAFLLALACGMNLYALEGKNENEWYKVKGGFKTCTVCTYKYKVGTLDESSKCKENIFKFDLSGALVEKVFFNDNEYSGKSIFQYDKSGKLIYEYKYGENDNFTNCSYYLYDLNDYLIEETCFWSTSDFNYNMCYINDSEGYRIERKAYHHLYEGLNPIPELSTYRYKHDHKVQEIKNVYNPLSDFNFDMINYKPNRRRLLEVSTYHNFSFSHKIIFEYDVEGNKIVEKYFDDENFYQGKFDYKYDIYGNLIEILYINSDGTTESKTEYIYSK
ncbi:MAG: hypothetical protein WCT77_04220 [Bacteroidota bacterium]|jgi:hypothetical protein